MDISSKTEIVLSDFEWFTAIQCGGRRNMFSRKNKLENKAGFPSDGDEWGVHIEGVCGEMAFAKCIGVYFDYTTETFKTKADVLDVEVRTRSKDYYELIIRSDDKDESPFVLVTGKSPKLTVVGWIYCKDAKQEKWLKNHGQRPPAYFVPHSDLRPIADLKKIMGL